MNALDATIDPPNRKPFHKRAKLGDITSIEMTKSCARDLTDRIKSAVDNVAEMLHRAHQERAWAALGYESWKSYCEAEFTMSERHSYRLIDFVEVKNILTDQLVSPTSESQVRPLTKLEPEQQPVAWERAIEIAGGEQPTAKQVEQAVEVLYPIERRSGFSEEAIAAGREAEKDSETLWKLKSVWKKCGKKDRQRFVYWLRGEHEEYYREQKAKWQADQGALK